MIWAAIPILLLFLGLWMHRKNFERIYRRLSKLSSAVSRDELYKEISVDHGANFSAMALASWAAFIVAFVYGLLPSMIPWLLRLGFPIASWYGLAFFAIIAVFLASIVLLLLRGRTVPVWLRLSEIYSMYPLSRNEKLLCAGMVLVLAASAALSVYNYVSYPFVSGAVDAISLLLLLMALIVLLFPVLKEFVGGIR